MKTVFKKSNPVTIRLSQMQEKWIASVCCQIQLVKWLIKPDELRMYQAFSIIEASDQGVIPQYFMRFSVPFLDMESYGRDLVQSWLNTWENQELRDKIDHDRLPDWNDSQKGEWLSSPGPGGFLDCMANFAKSIPGRESRLVIDIVPEVCFKYSDWVQWLSELTLIIPDELCAMVYDSVDSPQLPEFPSEVSTVSLVAGLEMQKAMKEVASSCDQTKPGPQFNLCVLNIGDCLQNNDVDGVHHWGQQALSIGSKANSVALQMAGFLSYGSALYQMNIFSDALPLFLSAKEIGLSHPHDLSVKALIIQTYSFLGGAFVSQGKYREGFQYYGEMAKEAQKQNNGLLEVEGRRLQASLPGRSIPDEEKFKALQLGFSAGQKLNSEVLPYSSMLPLCQQLAVMVRQSRDRVLTSKVENFAQLIWGNKWEELGVADSLVSFQSSTQRLETDVIRS